MKPIFTPFHLPLDEISVSDLRVLLCTREGWYIEYKEAVPKPPSIAKSVSAFANTYGGFLFYGVRESSREEAVAGQFIGVDAQEISPLLERIRQAIVAHSSPEPHFNVRTLYGPCEEISLESGRAIICIEVPKSLRAPHVHKSGAIYRRVADSSEPTAENDRHALGELFKRSEELLSSYRDWYSNDPDFHIGEESHPYLRILISADPWRERLPWLNASVKEFRKLLNPIDPPAILPFDSIVTTRNGFLARQAKGNTLTALTLSWALRRDLTSEIIVPIPEISIRSASECAYELEGYDNKELFAKALQGQVFEKLRILDLNQLFPIFRGIFESFRRITDFIGWEHGISLDFKVLNASRSCPFLDVSRVLERAELHGVPVVFNFMEPLRHKFHPDKLIRIENTDEGDQIDPHTHAVILLMEICLSMGLPLFEDVEEAEKDGSKIYGEIRDAGQRSLIAQTARSQRRS